MTLSIEELITIIFGAISLGFAIGYKVGISLKKQITEKQLSCNTLKDKPFSVSKGNMSYTGFDKVTLFYVDTKPTNIQCSHKARKIPFLFQKCTITNKRCELL